ncbi:MAG TPA: hypothetical protein VIM63_03165 [Rhodoferax sp.]
MINADMGLLHARVGQRNIGIQINFASASTPFVQENRLPLANDSFRVSGTEKIKNWTGVGNDRFGELDGNFWLTMSDRSRCLPGLGFAPLLTFNLTA